MRRSAVQSKARPTLALLLTAGLLWTSNPALAQDGGGGVRKWIFAAIGGLAAGVPAYYFNQAGNSPSSSCTSDACVAGIAIAIGVGIGYLIGNEMDSKSARRNAAGPSLEYTYRDVDIGMVPDRITAFRGGAAVVGLGGARIVTEDGELYSRAGGVRGIQDLAVVPDLDLLVLSTASNLLAFPIRQEDEQGQVIEGRGGGAVEAFQEKLAIAGLDSLHLVRVLRQGGDLDIESISTLANLEYVADLAYSGYSGLIWALMEDRLVAFDADFERVGELRLPAAGRSVRARGDRVVVAAGSHGAFVVDARDPSAPEMVEEFTGVRFAYAADLQGDRMYVAAGPEGLAVVDLAGPEPQVVGVARDVEVATDVMTTDDDGLVWILDRNGRGVQIARFGPQGTAAPDGGS